ncbi:uncharacterized protein LOC127787330 [Diospyros lotus]|uniref:uncharacterized protein LOC127787330 n=1 Tax=Diospyros lotus TaxID=55363 RepID=UPI00224E2C19|nr:uncharacterized protein LOC127787330 [Diospyros lotus]
MHIQRYRKWIPRKKHRYYHDHQDSDWYYSYAARESSGVPSWERQFCILVGSVPWEKVVVARHYMFCHNDVVKWNDSAGEEAFNNAKERFWAAINGLPCDIPLPDPNIYIDEIDWNPHIDPELIAGLDREYFNPDEGEKDKKVETTNEKVQNSPSTCAIGWQSNLFGCESPWEGNVLRDVEASKDVAKGWDRWDGTKNEPRNLNTIKNPWERTCTLDEGKLKDNAWGSWGDKSRGWKLQEGCNKQFKNYQSPWEHGHHNVGSVKGKGQSDARNSSWGWDHWDTSIHESRKFGSSYTSWEDGKDGGWGNYGDINWRKQRRNQNAGAKHLPPRRNGGSFGALNGGCQKRAGSPQNSSKFRSSRFEGDEYGTMHHWRKGPSQRRVSFA